MSSSDAPSGMSGIDYMNNTSVRARRALFESSGTGATANVKTASRSQQQRSGELLRNNVSNDASHIGMQGMPNAPNHDRDKSRPPLGFLSPNFKPRRFNRKENDHKVFQHNNNSQVECKNINTNTDSRDDTPVGNDSSATVPFQGLNHEENLEELNKKLHHIQAGLVEIEGERCQLIAKAKQLEIEQKHITKQLQNRELEIEALQKRCILAAEQSKESSALRSKNYMLTNLVSDLKLQLDEKNNDYLHASELKIQLQESKLLRDELKERLINVQKDHASVHNDLVKCLSTVDVLVGEKEEWENEKRRLQQQSDLQLEQQRLDHIQATTELRQELRAREKKVNDLDRLLQDKVGSIQRLRSQLSKVEASQADTLKLMTIEYDRKIQVIQHDLRHKVATEVEQKMHDEMLELQAKLHEKSSEIEALRLDVGAHMQELMVTTSELQKLEEDSATLDGLFRDVEVLELERFELSETLHERDTEIAELSAEILKLEIEKELCMQDTHKVQELADALENSKREWISSETRLIDIVDASKHLKTEIIRINTDNDITMCRVRAEYDATISTMQAKLHDAEEKIATCVVCHSESLAAKDETIAYLSSQKDMIALDFEEELASLKNEMQKAEFEFTIIEEQLKESQKADLSDKDAIIASLRSTIIEMMKQSQVEESKQSDKMTSFEKNVNGLDERCNGLKELLDKRTVQHQAETSALLQNKERMLKENEDLRCTIIEQNRRLDDLKVSGRKSLIRTDTKISQLEDQMRQLKATTLDMEDCAIVASREHTTEIEGLKRTILELESANEVLKVSIEHYQESSKEFREQKNKQQLAFDSELAAIEQRIDQREKKIAELEIVSKSQRLDHTESSHSMELSVAKLQMEVENLTKANFTLQCSVKERDEASCGSTSMMEKMNSTIEDLRRERDFANISLLSCERKLDSEKAQSAQLKETYDVLKTTATILEDECESLRINVDAAVNERNMLFADLDLERKLQQSEQDMLKNQLTAAEQNLVDHEAQMSQLEAALHDSTEKLAEMVTKSNDLQAMIDNKDIEYRSMEERSSILQVRVLDINDELRRSVSEWKRKEDEYIGEIHNERNMREILEADLEATCSRLETAKIESKDLTDLEKENVALKDKIRRQEAYLHRKIEQEKAVRERIIPGGHVKAPGSTVKTPARSTTKESMRKTASVASSTTRSTVPDHESTNVDVDLDTLLAD